MTSADGRRFIEISRNGRKEHLVFDKLIKPSSCVAGRATTCWKAHMEDESNAPVVIKDSWQRPKLLQEVTEKGIINMARYFYHETGCVNGIVDCRENVRKGIDVTKASNYKPASTKQEEAKDTARLDRSKNRSRTRQKRSSSCAKVPLPPSKRTSLPQNPKWGPISEPQTPSGIQGLDPRPQPHWGLGFFEMPLDYPRKSQKTPIFHKIKVLACIILLNHRDILLFFTPVLVLFLDFSMILL
jgi:hypothetical protein